MSYDSSADTLAHIGRVQELLDQVIWELDTRADAHDESKLEDPEKAIFDKYTPALRESEYGSDQYKANLKSMKVALDHHYATYRHHPEHHPDGIHSMNLIDLMEMLADWKAATERSPHGDLRRSIIDNAQRFGYDMNMQHLLHRTASDLGWL